MQATPMTSPARAEALDETSEAPDLVTELRQAVDDIEMGNYFELTPEQLRHWSETGELDVLDEWLFE